MKTNFDFLETLTESKDIKNLLTEKTSFSLKLDDNLKFKFSEQLLSYLSQIKDHPSYDGEITIERFKNDILKYFNNEFAAELLEFLIHVGALKHNTHIKLK